MPIKFSNKLANLIKIGKKEVVRIFAGSDMVYANLTATFISFNHTTTEKFVWGVGIQTLPTPTLTAEEKQLLLNSVKEGSLPTPSNNELTLVFEGWYEDKELNNKVDSISKYQEEDITLYANWVFSAKQYKAYYHYYVTVQYWATYSASVGGYVRPGTHYYWDNNNNHNVAPEGAYWEWYKGNNNYRQDTPLAGQCTWYANGRSKELTGSGAPYGTSGWGNPSDWTEGGGGWTYTDNVYDLRPGDIVIYSNHVMVVEENKGGGDLLVSHFNGTTDREYDPETGELVSFEYTLSSNGYDEYHDGDENWGGGGEFQGYLHYNR